MNHRSLVFTIFLFVLLLSPIVFGASVVKARTVFSHSLWPPGLAQAKGGVVVPTP